jgi:hypothetical protein
MTGSSTGTTKRKRPVVVAVVAALILAVIAGTAWATMPRDERARASTSDPSGGNTPGTRPSIAAMRFGDGSYLNGYEYLRGVNIYSLVFAGQRDDLTTLGEPQASYTYLAARGVKIVRLAVPWQRLQEIPPGGDAADGLAQPISQRYLDVVAEQVRRAGAAGIRTVIDLHNGCTYPWGAGDYVSGSLSCGNGITQTHVRTLWRAIANRFEGDERVLAYDIFNEPRWSVGIDNYRLYAQVAVDAIRSTGDQHTIWVEGILSEARGRLTAIAPNGPWIEDRLGKVMYSEHFYDNEDGKVYSSADDHTKVLTQLKAFGEWCTKWSVRCSVGEVGWPSGGTGGVQSATSASQWNALFEKFYRLADAYQLDVTYFAASSATKTGTLLAYVSSDPGVPSGKGINTSLSQSKVIQAHLSRLAD